MIATVYFDISGLRFPEKTKANINKGLVYLSNLEEARSQYLEGKLVLEYGNNILRTIPNSVYGYSEIKLPSGFVASMDKFYNEYRKEVEIRSDHIQSLVTFLWLIKDNSVGIYGTYGQIPALHIVTGKSRSVLNYTCTGKIEPTIFSAEEVQFAGELVVKYFSICGMLPKKYEKTNILYEYDEQNKFVKGIDPGVHTEFSYFEQTALDRALRFLVIARGQSYLIYKVAYYMPIFECLFSTQNTDVTYRIASRASAYIGKSRNERKEIFEKIIKGYNIRSKFIHGQKLDKIDDEELSELSIYIDSYLRRILLKVLNIDSLIFTKYSTTERDKYLDARVMRLPFNHKVVKKAIQQREEQKQKEAEKAEKKKLKGKSNLSK